MPKKPTARRPLAFQIGSNHTHVNSNNSLGPPPSPPPDSRHTIWGMVIVTLAAILAVSAMAGVTSVFAVNGLGEFHTIPQPEVTLDDRAVDAAGRGRPAVDSDHERGDR